MSMAIVGKIESIDIVTQDAMELASSPCLSEEKESTVGIGRQPTFRY